MVYITKLHIGHGYRNMGGLEDILGCMGYGILAQEKRL